MFARSVWLIGFSMTVLGMCAFALSAGAAIDSTTGQIQLISPPAGVLFPPHPTVDTSCPVAGECLASDTTMFAFNEQQCVKAPIDLPVDITEPGTYDSTSDLTSGAIPAGTLVSSQFVQSESPTTNRSTFLDGTVHTDAPILGIAVLSHALNLTDALGAIGTAYPTGVFGRGLELDNSQTDFVVEVTDMHTVEIHSQVRLHADQVRIITACTPATIVVKKLTVPSGDPTQFQFAGDLNGTIGDGGTLSSTVAPGTYASTEDVPSGWSLSSISCDDPGSSGSLGTATATFNVSSGQTVTCTFTDTKNLATCTAAPIASNFNGTAINAGNWIWFNSVFKISGVGAKPVTLYANASTITFSAGGTNYSLNVPNAQITIDPAATQATTSFDTGTNTWKTTVPKGLSGNTFLDGLGFQVPVKIAGGTNPVTWNATFTTDTPGISFNWQWAAAVYTSFSADDNALGVKPVDDNKASTYKNSDHAGTPENFKAFVVGGARGGGGSNFTGSYSGTGNGRCS